MSSPPSPSLRPGTILVLLAALLGLAWYGQGQLFHSLAFLFQVAQAIFPGLSVIQGAS